jgi:hypothetical protein
MKTDSEPELKQDLKFLTVKNNYTNDELTFAVNFQKRLLWYVDTTSKLLDLIPGEFDNFFDKQNNFIND